MNPDVIQFQCSACQSVLTVPVHLAGITGPCPTCGQTITSPAGTPSISRQGLGAAPSYDTITQPQEKPNANTEPVQPLATARQPQKPAGVSPGLLARSTFPNAPMQPQATPSWQAPELTQTIKSGNLPLASGLPPSAFVQPSLSGNLLPQQRLVGQIPMTGGLPQAAANPMTWGSGLNQAPPATGLPSVSLSLPQRQLGHGSLIPGVSAPSVESFADRSETSSLLNQALSAAPLSPSNSQSFQDSPDPLPIEPTAHSGVRSRSLKKPRRSANVAMLGLALIMLGTALAATGWLFRQPILQLAEQFVPKSAPTDPAVLPENPRPASPLIGITPSEPMMAQSTAVVPAPFKATPTMPEEIIKAAIPKSETGTSKMTEAAALAVTTKDSHRKEATTASTNSPIKQANLDDSSMTASDRGEIILDIPPEAKPAADALQKFLAASSLEERLKYTLAVDSMKPLMEEYYSKDPSRPIPVDLISLVRLNPKPQLGGGAHAIFGVESKTWKFAIPVMLEERDGSFKVDWLSFVEFKDRRLEHYLTNYQEGPALFHVSMTRTHYFEDKIPNPGNKEAFRINPAPPNPFAATVFVDKDSALSRDLRDKVPWGAQVFAIVELEWIKLGDQSWVQMSAVPQLNWYSVPSAPKAVKAGSSIQRNDSTQMPTETQQAAPIGR